MISVIGFIIGFLIGLGLVFFMERREDKALSKLAEERESRELHQVIVNAIGEGEYNNLEEKHKGILNTFIERYSEDDDNIT